MMTNAKDSAEVIKFSNKKTAVRPAMDSEELNDSKDW